MEEWRAMSVEERHLLLNAQVDDFQPNTSVRPQTNRPPPPPSNQQQHNVVSHESSENSDEEEDEILKSILEQSKKETRMTEEEKTKLVLLESLKEVNINDKSLREGKEAYERRMRELAEKELREKDEKRIKLEDPHNMTDAYQIQKKREQEDIEKAISESLGIQIQVNGLGEEEDMPVDIEPLTTASSVNPPPSPARPTSLPGPPSQPALTQSNSGPNIEGKSEPNLGAVPRRKHTSIPTPPTQTPLAPAHNDPDFPPTLGDEEAQLAWALEASKSQSRPSSPILDGAVGGIPDEDEQLAWALEVSQPKESPKESEAGSAGPDLISVLTPEEQVELAMRLSQPSRTPTALGSSSPLRSTSTHRIHPAPSSSPHRMSPAPQPKPEGLRLIVIDGCNVAMAHGLHRNFSVRGLVLAYEHFREKGHQV